MDQPVAAADRLAHGIRTAFRRHTQGECVARIGRCIELLDERDIWQRPNAASNSVGNLLLHLCGNITQWILVSFSTLDDRRDRPAEFAAASGASGRELHARLASIVADACDVVDRLSIDELLRERTIQARYRETGLAAVLHVMEHMSGHAGQIYAWTKQVTGKDLAFYDL